MKCWIRKAPALLLVALAACAEHPVDRMVPASAGPVLVPVDPPTGAEPLNPAYGVVVGGGHRSRNHMENLYNRAKTMGVGWVKISVGWDALHPSGHGLDSTEVRKAKDAVAVARHLGFQVNVLVDGTPAWVQACGQPWSVYAGVPDCGDRRYPPDPAMYLALQMFWAEMLDVHFTSFPHDVQLWSVRNEVNDTAYFKVAPGRDVVGDYGTLLAYTANEIRARGGRVGAPELAQHGDHNDFLRRLLKGYHPYLDVVTVHKYVASGLLGTEMLNHRRNIDSIAPGKPLWLSETGTTYTTGEEDQARHIAGMLQVHNQYRNSYNWPVTIYFALDGPLHQNGTIVYPDSWLVHEDVNTGYAVRSVPYNCFKWWAWYRVSAQPHACSSTGIP